MEAEARGVGSLARLLIQDHCNSSLLQKLSFSFFKSLYDPQNIKTAKVHCIKIEVISNSQHKYIISFTLENFRSLESVNSSVSKKMLLLQDSCFRFKQKQSTLLFVQKWAIRKTPLRVRQRSGAVSFLSISKSSPKSFFPPPLLLCRLKATSVRVYCCATKHQLFIKTKFCLLPTSKNLTVNILQIFCSTLSLGLDV